MKYKVQIHVIDYRTCEVVVEAGNKAEALTKAEDMSESGDADYELVDYKTWKKPTIRRVKA